MSVHDLWKGKRTGPGRRWEVRWRESGRERRRRFTHRHAADEWNATVRLRPDERRATTPTTVGDLYPAWLDSKAGLKPSTLANYRTVWERMVEPEWGSAPVDQVRAGDVQAWVGRCQKVSPSLARSALSVLSGVMRHATMSGLVAANPCAGLKRPAPSRAEVTPLTMGQVAALAEAAAPHELVVWVLATTGVRFGEMAGLRVRDLDVKAGRLVVARSVSTVDSRLVESLPKSGRRRVVPIPGWLAVELAASVEGRPGDAPLLPTGAGGVWRATSWRRVWRGDRGRDGALQRAGLPLSTRVHDLRHTAAVIMLEGGVSPRTVQAVLGHSSLTMTLDLYGRWVSPDLDAAAGVWSDVMWR